MVFFVICCKYKRTSKHCSNAALYTVLYIYIYTQLFPNKSETFIFLKFRSKFYNLLAGTEKLFLVKH